MPITQERLYALMIEAEGMARVLQQTHETINTILHANTADSTKLTMLDAVIEDLKVRPTVTERERQHYNSSARRNIAVRERMRLERRAKGVPERTLPGSPEQLLKEYHERQQTRADDEAYERFNRGESEPQ
jgi:hypothetical protein